MRSTFTLLYLKFPTLMFVFNDTRVYVAQISLANKFGKKAQIHTISHNLEGGEGGGGQVGKFPHNPVFSESVPKEYQVFVWEAVVENLNFGVFQCFWLRMKYMCVCPIL